MYINLQECAKRNSYSLSWNFLEEVDSTNEFLKRKTKVDCLRKPSLVVVRKQTAGKGTRGRVWIDDPEACLKVSFLLPLKKNLFGPTHLSPLVAVLCCRALRQLGYKNVSLKWPNDLVVNGEKVGGILIEKISLEEKDYLIIGIGLNLSPSKIGEKLQKEVGSLLDKMPEEGLQRIREDILVELAGQLEKITSVAVVLLDECIISEWTAYDEYFGKRITLLSAGKEPITGEDMGIKKDGSLILRSGNETKSFCIGEVSVKL